MADLGHGHSPYKCWCHARPFISRHKKYMADSHNIILRTITCFSQPWFYRFKSNPSKYPDPDSFDTIDQVVPLLMYPNKKEAPEGAP